MAALRLLMIDNYDSFTYNLVQYLGELGADVRVVRNDAIGLDDVARDLPDGIVISPGPCTPREAGMSVPMVERFAGVVPLLGVCLGHQSIGAAYGGTIVRADRIMHGKTSPIHHDGSGVFQGIPNPFEATRYHSLVIDPESLPPELERTAWTEEGEIMGVRHRELAVEGVQFHPESILTVDGKSLLRKLLGLARTGEIVVSVRDVLQALVDGAPLGADVLDAAIGSMLDGSASPAEVGGLLVGLRVRGETAHEIGAVARALRTRMTPVPGVPAGAVDTCGTGGDGAGTFNVSTAAALVVAGAGVPVAKHGNRAVSGRVGSADVLEALGVPLDLAPDALGACIREAGIAFLYAPALHPAMKAVAEVRRGLGVRTVFNLVGPLANPAGVRRQVIGVSGARWLRPMAEALRALGAETAWVVHGYGGLDELALAGPSRVAQLRDGELTEHEVDPQALGLEKVATEALRVASVDESVARIRSVLAGEPGPARDIVCLNAAAALVVAGKVRSVAEGLDEARTAVDSGAAAHALERLAGCAS